MRCTYIIYSSITHSTPYKIWWTTSVFNNPHTFLWLLLWHPVAIIPKMSPLIRKTIHKTLNFTSMHNTCWPEHYGGASEPVTHYLSTHPSACLFYSHFHRAPTHPSKRQLSDKYPVMSSSYITYLFSTLAKSNLLDIDILQLLLFQV